MQDLPDSLHQNGYPSTRKHLSVRLLRNGRKLSYREDSEHFGTRPVPLVTRGFAET
jgi:hypothetical protein